jgi:hypothetical protein
VPKVGVAHTDVDHLEVAFVIADLGTRRCELYAPADEVLPSVDAAGGAATRVERGERPAGAGGRLGGDRFERSRERFEVIVGWLDGEEAGGLEHSQLELRIETHGRELLRALFQDHLDLRAERELRAERVADVRCVERRVEFKGDRDPVNHGRAGRGVHPRETGEKVLITDWTPDW